MWTGAGNYFSIVFYMRFWYYSMRLPVKPFHTKKPYSYSRRNNLQAIISLLELQKDDIQDEATRSSLDAMSSRIYSMAAVHDVLYQKADGHLVDFLEYTRKLCAHLSHLTANEKPRFNLQIPRQLFNLETRNDGGAIYAIHFQEKNRPA